MCLTVAFNLFTLRLKPSIELASLILKRASSSFAFVFSKKGFDFCFDFVNSLRSFTMAESIESTMADFSREIVDLVVVCRV